jgi:hypothetical protein
VRYLAFNLLPGIQYPSPGGDGPKLINLLQMREKHLLQDRIQLLGPVRHSDVRSVSDDSQQVTASLEIDCL